MMSFLGYIAPHQVLDAVGHSLDQLTQRHWLQVELVEGGPA